MKNISYILAFFALTLSSCDTDEVQIELEDQVVVEGFLMANRPIDSIQLFKVSPYTSDEPAETIDDALIKMEVDGSSVNLESTGSGGYYQLSSELGKVNTVYSIEFEYNGQIIAASTIIPEKPLNLMLSDSSISLQRIRDFTDIQGASFPDPIEVSWEAEESAYYFISIENLESNPEPVNELFEVDEDAGNVNISTNPDIINSYFLDTRRNLAQFGTYRIIVYSVNPEYAALFENISNESTSLSEPATNIVNGKGIFTGINSDTTYLEVIPL